MSHVTGIFASDASPKKLNDNSVSQNQTTSERFEEANIEASRTQNLTTSEPFEEPIIEVSREENNGTGTEEKKRAENMLIIEEASN